MILEKGHYVPNEMKEEKYEMLAEIQSHVNFLFKKKNKTNQ